MFTLTVAAKVDEKGILTLQMPPQVSPGYHQIVIVIEEAEFIEKANGIHHHELSKTKGAFVLPTHDVGPWPENFSLRREDLYDD